MNTEAMNKIQALELIAGTLKSDEKWKAFDEFVDELVNKPAGILKKSVIKGLVLEAMGESLENYKEDTVNERIKGRREEESRHVEKRLRSIQSLISQAYNKASKSKGPAKKRSKMTVNLPSSPDVNTDLQTFEGFKALLMYRLDQLKLTELSEVEGLVRRSMKVAKDTERVVATA